MVDCTWELLDNSSAGAEENDDDETVADVSWFDAIPFWLTFSEDSSCPTLMSSEVMVVDLGALPGVGKAVSCFGRSFESLGFKKEE